MLRPLRGDPQMTFHSSASTILITLAFVRSDIMVVGISKIPLPMSKRIRPGLRSCSAIFAVFWVDVNARKPTETNGNLRKTTQTNENQRKPTKNTPRRHASCLKLPETSRVHRKTHKSARSLNGTKQTSPELSDQSNGNQRKPPQGVMPAV